MQYKFNKECINLYILKEMSVMNYIISEGNFNQKSVRIVQEIQIESKYYLERLDLLKFFYDEKHYRKIRYIITTINEFSKKYLEDNKVISIYKKDISFEKKSFQQDNEFIKETVEIYMEKKEIADEIKKIGIKFNNDLRIMILRLYDLENASIFLIEDICKKINFEETISISKMLKVIG